MTDRPTNNNTTLVVEYAHNNHGQSLTAHELRKLRMLCKSLAGIVTEFYFIGEHSPDSDGEDTHIILKDVRTT